MADQNERDSRTEEPTEKKIEDALESGNLPVSREASTFSFVAALLIIAAYVVKTSLTGLTQTLAQVFENPGGWRLDSSTDVILLVAAAFSEALRFLLPPLAILLIAGLASNFLQHAPRFVWTRIQPDWNRISPDAGWKKIFSFQGGTEFVKSIVKFMTILFIVIVILHSQQSILLNIMFVDTTVLPDLILLLAMRLLSAIAIMTIVLFSFDLFWVRTHWRRNLRMSRQEIKDEIKQSEGDPLMKARLRSIALDRLRKSMISAVPKATLVIVNPTHYAVALRFVREEGGAPHVLSKGTDLIALKIRAIAEENGIPVIEDKPLARSLYDSVEINKSIPPEFYRAVAEVLHFIYARNGNKSPIQ